MYVKCDVCEYQTDEPRMCGEFLGSYWLCDQCLRILFEMIKEKLQGR